jgi:ABC-type antimicrobial peptide transport system permease subunit
MILQDAMLLVLAGVAVGIPVALAMTKLVRSLLAVSPTDPVAFIMASLALLFTAALAGYVPARRAMRVDPAVLLRLE